MSIHIRCYNDAYFLISRNRNIPIITMMCRVDVNITMYKQIEWLLAINLLETHGDDIDEWATFDLYSDKRVVALDRLLGDDDVLIIAAQPIAYHRYVLFFSLIALSFYYLKKS